MISQQARMAGHAKFANSEWIAFPSLCPLLSSPHVWEV
jgi:hypothetical protein